MEEVIDSRGVWGAESGELESRIGEGWRGVKDAPQASAWDD